MHGMDQCWPSMVQRQCCSPTNQSGLGDVGVHHIGLPVADEIAECLEGRQVIEGGNRPAQPLQPCQGHAHRLGLLNLVALYLPGGDEHLIPRRQLLCRERLRPPGSTPQVHPGNEMSDSHGPRFSRTIACPP